MSAILSNQLTCSIMSHIGGGGGGGVGWPGGTETVGCGRKAM